MPRGPPISETRGQPMAGQAQVEAGGALVEACAVPLANDDRSKVNGGGGPAWSLGLRNSFSFFDVKY